MNLIEHLKRQIAFSRATFGPGDRTKGICEHIEEELDEIRVDHAGDIPTAPEWVDVVVLGFDGLWRAVAAQYPSATHDKLAEMCVTMLVAKQNKNEKRDWPDWRTTSADKKINHVRGTHD